MTLLPLTVPEVRRLLLISTEPTEHVGFRLAWSRFRRRHQATAMACHRHRRARQQPLDCGSVVTQRLKTIDLVLTEQHWERIVGLLPPEKPPTGRPNTDHRLILDGILWVIRTGSAWRDLPEQFGPWETVHSRHLRWKRAGIWQQIYTILTGRDSSTLS